MVRSGAKSIGRRIAGNASECAGAAAGSLAAGAIGAAAAGPAGAAVGALAAGGAEWVLQKIGSEIKRRVLSPSEERRVGEVYDTASKLIGDRIANGEKLRDDDFFENSDDGRSEAEEVLEGILITAQREYEERKLAYLSRLYASIAFHPEISAPMANHMIKIMDSLTYRQIVILHLVGGLAATEKQLPGMSIRKRSAYTSVSGTENVAIASEIFELYRMSLLGSSEAILDAAGINPSALSIIGYGAHLYILMDLSKLEDHDGLQEIVGEIVEFLTGKTAIRPK